VRANKGHRDHARGQDRGHHSGPHWPTNISFDGPDLRDLYIGSVRKDYVLHARSPIPGAPLVHKGR